jgi:hypothetical protein
MFDHEARWDRALPNDTSHAPGTFIPVICLIDKGKIIPKSFIWRNRSTSITKINFSWKDKKGREVLYFFSVTTPYGTFEIAFSRENLSWRLIRLIGP